MCGMEEVMKAALVNLFFGACVPGV